MRTILGKPFGRRKKRERDLRMGRLAESHRSADVRQKGRGRGKEIVADPEEMADRFYELRDTRRLRDDIIDDR
ncbi:hypothetical protein KM043_010982 [Ampulex compressa]|nr:hypothetical protein KM043_010982 [Ampulex compressa]